VSLGIGLVRGSTIILLVDGNFFSLDGVSNKMIMPLNMLNFPVELRILSKLKGSNVIAHKLYKIINSRNETKILEKTT